MKSLTVAIVCAVFALSSVYAQQPQVEAKKGTPASEKKSEKVKKEPSAAQKKQQELMKKCIAEAKAKGVKGKKEHSKFMSGCLKG